MDISYKKRNKDNRVIEECQNRIDSSKQSRVLLRENISTGEIRKLVSFLYKFLMGDGCMKNIDIIFGRLFFVAVFKKAYMYRYIPKPKYLGN